MSAERRQSGVTVTPQFWQRTPMPDAALMAALEGLRCLAAEEEEEALNEVAPKDWCSSWEELAMVREVATEGRGELGDNGIELDR